MLKYTIKNFVINKTTNAIRNIVAKIDAPSKYLFPGGKWDLNKTWNLTKYWGKL